ncbi:CAP domain-containing protein [Brachyspira hampsonii]|uniref:SCP-like extracellular protein n=1 Tax=Brachyspira hampsonii 30446 TaxID=1289135 RepID=A0A2U4F181_9SPIR|nr:CAP domain-containing protein [Brachyspira hampsonii]EKV56007.1 SCP-like extracellular protein [Brachyspira hampsonii 30446]MBW5388809.1 CAP domain-containing protein [Brachyspira hampsonii]MBW5395679.1 CAP domain-containing protein [Brachyspira hampsonii]OEJ20452.1 serine protease [Brachyspira hampsonii]
MVNIIIKMIFVIIASASFLYAQDYNDDINTMLKTFNEIRDNENLYPFEIDDKLNNIADIRAKELAISFSHIRPNNTKYDELLYENRIIVYSSNENIAYRFKNAETVVSYWMNSNKYKVNIISDKFTHIGVSHYSINGEDFWVVIFAQLRR